jgi:hypothetical protein
VTMHVHQGSVAVRTKYTYRTLFRTWPVCSVADAMRCFFSTSRDEASASACITAQPATTKRGGPQSRGNPLELGPKITVRETEAGTDAGTDSRCPHWRWSFASSTAVLRCRQSTVSTTAAEGSILQFSLLRDDERMYVKLTIVLGRRHGLMHLTQCPFTLHAWVRPCGGASQR